MSDIDKRLESLEKQIVDLKIKNMILSEFVATTIYKSLTSQALTPEFVQTCVSQSRQILD